MVGGSVKMGTEVWLKARACWQLQTAKENVRVYRVGARKAPLNH